MLKTDTPRYPLLEDLLTIKGLSLQAMYTNADVASLFGVSIRTVQNRVANGTLASRKLIGRARFLPVDLEDFLASSRNDREN